MADKNPFANVGLGMFGAEGASGGVGQDALALATAYGIDKSGLKGFLNDKGFAKNAQGQWVYQAPAQTASSGLNYQNGSDMGGGFNPAAGVAPPSPAPVAPVAPTIQQAVVPSAPAMTPAPITTAPPSGLGNRILDNDWHGSDNSDQEQQNQFASQSASQFVPGMGSGQGSDGNSDMLKQMAIKMMLG
jgi:hypothetical protein